MESWVQFDFFLQTNFKHCADDADLVFKLAQTYLLTHTIHIRTIWCKPSKFLSFKIWQNSMYSIF